MARRTRTARPKPIIRKVYFYRMSPAGEALQFLPGEIQRLMNLPFQEAGRYSSDGDGNRVALWPETAEFPLKLKFGKTRLTNLPVKERGGKISPLDLAVDEGLLELCHVIIYENGFVAAEFNFEGPRMTRLAEYLYEKRHLFSEKISFLPLFEKDILGLVEAMATIKFLELKGEPDAKAVLAKADQNLAGAFDAMVQLGGTESVSLELSGHNSPRSKLRDIATKLAKLAQSRPALVQHGVKVLKIRGFNSEGRVDIIDLLEDHLVSVKEFERLHENGKAVDSEAAFEQLDQAYKEKEAELRGAIVGRTFAE